jgi:hypothetical protein
VSEVADVAANPYAAPAATSESEAVAADITWHELEWFAAPGALTWWRLSRNGRRAGLWLSWNWPAAIFSLLWFAYRKMWREFLVIFASNACFQLLMSVVAGLLGRDYLLGFWWDFGLAMGVYSVVLGLLGNALYLRRARLEIVEARREFPGDWTGLTVRLTRRGATSHWWLLAGIGASLGGDQIADQVNAAVLAWLF